MNKRLPIHVFPKWKVETKVDLFLEVATFLSNQNRTDDISRIVDDLVERERMGSTLIAEGFAVPHIETKALKQTTLLFVQLQHPIDDWEWDFAVDTCLFLFVCPDDPKETMDQIKKLMNLLASDYTIKRLRENTMITEEDVYQALEKGELDVNEF